MNKLIVFAAVGCFGLGACERGPTGTSPYDSGTSRGRNAHPMPGSTVVATTTDSAERPDPLQHHPGDWPDAQQSGRGRQHSPVTLRAAFRDKRVETGV